VLQARNDRISSKWEKETGAMRRFGSALRALAAGALVLGLAAVQPAGVLAATVTVSSCSQAGLTSAISAAGNNGTVQFGADCSITLSSTITLSQSVTIDGNGHAVTISGGHTATVTGVRVFIVNSSFTVTLNDLTIANGDDVDVGGGIDNSGTLMVTNSTFSGNSASLGGGGILNGGNLTVTNSTFSGNSADDGGGILNGGNLTVTNSTFNGNLAGGDGGGIFNSGSLTVTNSTFSGNTAVTPTQPGGGIFNLGTATLANTIVANSPSGGDCFGTITDNGGNFADDGSCDFSQSSSKNNATGLNLGALANNGGPTQTIALGAGSSAIDFTTCLQTIDQRGFLRPDDGEPKCDSGAYESGAIPDTTPPTIKISLSPSTPNGQNGWYTSAVTLTVSATDPDNAPATLQTRCVLDPSSLPANFAALPSGACPYLGPTGASVISDGTHTLYAASIDPAGNAEAVQSVPFKIDTTPPTVTYTGNAGTYTVDQQVQITCTATDATSGVASSTCQNISGPAYSFGLGTHSFTATATDNAGNIGHGMTSFTVSATPSSLQSLINRFCTDPSVAASLDQDVVNIAHAPNPGAKAGMLQGFTQLVQAQTGKSLTSDQAKVLITLANALP
jgi:hypothetical protein